MSEKYVAARMCPECGTDSIVYNSRENAQGEIIRWRQCLYCGYKFVTVERYERSLLTGGRPRKGG